MPLTPVEIRHVELRRAWLRGYNAIRIDRLLERDRGQLRGGLARARRPRRPARGARGRGAKHRELEALLRSTLVSAERAAQDMKEQARRESDLIVQEAHAEGRVASRGSRPRSDSGSTRTRGGSARCCGLPSRRSTNPPDESRGEGRDDSRQSPEEGRRGRRGRHPQGRRLGGRGSRISLGRGRPERSSVGSSRRGRVSATLDLARFRTSSRAERTRLHRPRSGGHTTTAR